MNGTVRLRDGLRMCVLTFLAVRLALFVLSVAGVGLVPLPPGQPTGVPGWPADPVTGGWHNLFTATERQDALWFLRIAADGYRPDDLSAAFFPMYPIAVRAVAWLPGVGTLAAALLVSNAAFLGSLVLLHGIARLEFGDEIAADRAVRAAALFPTAFFLMAPYGESLFLLASLAAVWFARGERWPFAVLAGLAAGLTRSAGLALSAGLAVEAPGAPDARRFLGRLAVAAAPALGVAAYLAVWWAWTGEPLAPLDAQSAWRSELVAPWTPLVRGFELAIRGGGWWLVDALFVAGTLAILVAGIRVVRPSYVAYGLASLVLPLFAMFPGRPFLSMPRFASVVFPVALILGRQRAIPEPLVTAVLAGGWAVLAVLFVNWQYIF